MDLAVLSANVLVANGLLCVLLRVVSVLLRGSVKIGPTFACRQQRQMKMAQCGGRLGILADPSSSTLQS